MGVRWIGIAEESTYGTAVTSPDHSMRYLELDLSPDQQRIIEFESAYREKEQSLLGPFIGSGRLTAYARPDDIGYFLKWLTGSVTSAQVGSSSVYTHTFTLADSVKSFTLTDNRGISGSSGSRACVGCAMKSLTLEAPARGALTFEANIQYQWEELITEPTMGTLSSLRPFMFYDGSITYGGSSLARVEAIRFTWENGMPDDTHCIGSRKLPGIDLEGVEVSFEVDMKLTDWSIRKYFYGASNATEPQDEETTYALNVTFTGQPTGESESGAEYYKIELNFPKVVLTENPASVSRRDRMTQRATFVALRDSNNYIKLWNKETSY
ncbi:MAG: hypothetical protein DRI61_04730 [Chloroflexi bacterium]|nr:MAG: hypothetical protein DRI61_04730 [Chloroflexota bacterium]